MPKGCFVVLSHNLKVDLRNRFHLCRKLYHFMMDLLEKVMHFIEEENYSALEAIYNAELAKLCKCAAISNKGLLAEDLSASSNNPKKDAHLMSDKE